MAKGFELMLADYCSYCGDFEPDISRIEASDAFEVRYITTICCNNALKCKKIKDNLEVRLASGRFGEK